jgi:hypothetical protein
MVQSYEISERNQRENAVFLLIIGEKALPLQA